MCDMGEITLSGNLKGTTENQIANNLILKAKGFFKWNQNHLERDNHDILATKTRFRRIDN